MQEEIITTTTTTLVKQAIRRKGGFKKDGSTHHSGIKNEHNIVAFLNNKSSIIGQHLRPTPIYIVTHKGGTQTKADAVVLNQDTKEEFTLSIKNHKTGTFDWLNSTKGFPEEIQNILKERTKEIKLSYQTHKNVDTSRIEVDTMFSTALESLKTNHCFLSDIIHTIFDKYTDAILVNHEKNGELIYFEKKELRELSGFTDYTYYLKHKEGTCSAQIMRRQNPDSEEINTNLRLRLVLNNGVNALVGTSSKNKTSVPCLKIQQDSVDDFIHKIENKIIEKYN